MLQTNFTTLESKLKQLSKGSQVKISHLSTLCVENFFSIIRSKILYPNIYEYSVVYSKAWNEFIKRNTMDLAMTLPSRQLSSNHYYNDNTSTKFSKDFANKYLEKKKERKNY